MRVRRERSEKATNKKKEFLRKAKQSRCERAVVCLFVRMAGVLFIIWIPCEHYEQALAGDKQVWEKTTPIKSRHVPALNSNSSDEKVRKETGCWHFLKVCLWFL